MIKSGQQRVRRFNGASMVMRTIHGKLGGKVSTIVKADCIPVTTQLAIPSAQQLLNEKKRERNKIAADLQKNL